MKRLESYTENRVVAWAERNGYLQTKLLGRAGLPDRVFWLPGGRPVLMEFKRKGQKPTKLQRHYMTQLAAIGYEVNWSDDYEEAIAYLRSFTPNS